MQKLSLFENGLERGTRGKWDFPFSGGEGWCDIEKFEGHRFECHFHPETEVTLILEGEMYYQTNGIVRVLRAGDAVFVNANVMHAAWQKDNNPCRYQPINFSLSLVSGGENSLIDREYIAPVLRDHLLPALFLSQENPHDMEIINAMRVIPQLIEMHVDGYEILVKAAVCRLWYLLYRTLGTNREICRDKGSDPVKKAIMYMETHYQEKITLSDLSLSCGLSRSEFCRVFHRYTGRTPFAYLQHLRVRRSLPDLADRSLSVTDVANRCGFSGGSYYAEVFRRFFRTSPLEYRHAME